MAQDRDMRFAGRALSAGSTNWPSVAEDLIAAAGLAAGVLLAAAAAPRG